MFVLNVAHGSPGDEHFCPPPPYIYICTGMRGPYCLPGSSGGEKNEEYFKRLFPAFVWAQERTHASLPLSLYNPFETAVSFWGQTSQIVSSLPPRTGLQY